MLKLFPIAALCLTLPTLSYADSLDREERKGEPRFRVSAGIAQGELKDSVGTTDETGYTLEVSGEFNQYVGINFEAARYSDSITVLNQTLDVDLNTYAMNLDIGYTFNDRSDFEVKPFVALGMMRHEMDYIPGESTFSYGTGVRASINDWLTLSIEAEWAKFDWYDTQVIALKMGYRY
jgi:hemolysin activation/secretion protein